MLSAAIQPDSALRTGRLSNGLRYYIIPNGRPTARAELRLVIDAGSVLEADDQRGLAHAVEHMLFRGTTHFPGHAVDDYLQTIGMRPGGDINASTSQDQTVVNLTVPTDRAGVLDSALAILADMAGAVTFNSDQARSEAGVVMAEWLARSDATQRLRDARDDILLAGSPYAGHPIIGDTAILRRFDVAAMRRFYTDWYRPDLMAVVAVGDFDAGTVEGLITRRFRYLRAPGHPRPRPEITVPRLVGSRAALLRDPESAASRIAMWYPAPPTVQRHLGDYRESLIDELWRRILRDRLEDAAARRDSPILSADATSWGLARPVGANVVTANAVRGRERAAIETVAGEIGRLARFGVSPDETNRRAADLLREFRVADESSDDSWDLAEGLIDTFLTGDVVVTRSSAYELSRQLLPTIHASDILQRVRGIAVDSESAVLVTEPSDAPSPGSAEAIAQYAHTAAEAATAIPPDSSATIALMPNLPTPGRIVSERSTDLGTFDWTLSNGMRVILKPTRFSVDDIELRIFGPGGASLASDADYPSAYLSDGVVASTGIGPLSGRALARRIAPTSVDLTPTVRNDAVEFTGSAAPRDIDLLFQLVNLYFTAPRADTAAFRRYKQRAAAYAHGRTVDPDEIFADSVAATVTGHDVRALTQSARFVDAVRLGTALDFWKARMANASGFTVVLTGDFALVRMRQLASQYLASLPAGRPEKQRPRTYRFPRGVVRRKIVAGMGPRARTEITISGAYDGSSEAADGLEEAQEVAERALNDDLRERLGGTYDASVTSTYSSAPPRHFEMTIDFAAQPERIDSLAKAALRELERLRVAGPTDLEAAKVIAARTRDLDGESESNSYWASALAWHARMGWPVAELGTRDIRAKLVTRRSLAAACATYLNAAQYVEVTVIPSPSVRLNGVRSPSVFATRRPIPP